MIEPRSNLGIVLALLVSFPTVPGAATVAWAGHTWNVTTGGLAGGNTGSAANVRVDSSGYMHLKIALINGKWTCAEVFSADNIGFGTYQWQIDGPVDKLDKNVVLGLYPYGPATGIGADGTNEIDIEFARWGNAAWDNGNYTVYPNSGTTVGQTTFAFALGGTYSTSTFLWNTSSISYRLQEGFKALSDNSGTIKTWTYAPSNASNNIPQKAVPLGMNLWLCDGCGGAPSNNQPVEIVLRNFTFVPPGDALRTAAPPSGQSTGLHLFRERGSLFLRLEAPSPTDRRIAILDPRGRLERSLLLPAGTTRLALPGISPGIHAIQAPGIPPTLMVAE